MSISVDSASDVPPWRLRRLAKKAYRARQRGEDAFFRLAESSRMSPRGLRLLADAWAQGGAGGVAALAPAEGLLTPHLVGEVDATLEGWRRQHYPLETLQWEVWRNRVTVWQIVPGPNRLGPVERRPVLQLRRTADDVWHLYRKAAQGEWWPVIVSGGARATSLQDCLDAVRLDVARQFWPPRSPRPLRGRP